MTSAFNRLILERGYEAISVADVAELANVGRSTFYEHFSGLDDLLAQSLSGHLAVLAGASLGPEPDPMMTRVLRHFWEQRKVAGALLGGGAQRVVCALLSKQFEAALETQWPIRPGGPAYRRKLVAIQLAAGQLAVLGAWVSGRLSASTEEIAETLRTSCRAVAAATFGSAA